MKKRITNNYFFSLNFYVRFSIACSHSQCKSLHKKINHKWAVKNKKVTEIFEIFEIVKQR